MVDDIKRSLGLMAEASSGQRGEAEAIAAALQDRTYAVCSSRATDSHRDGSLRRLNQ